MYHAIEYDQSVVILAVMLLCYGTSLIFAIQVAHDAAMAYMNSKEPQYRTIADVIIMALAKTKGVSHRK